MVQSIGNNPLGLQSSLFQAQKIQRTAEERIGSGLQVNRAADNAAGLAIINRLISQSEGASQSIRNAVDGVSLTQVAGGTLSAVTSGIQRIRELSLQAANGILSDSDRSSLQAEVKHLQSGIADSLSQAQFNGVNLFSTGDSIRFQIGDQAGDTIELSGKDFSASIASIAAIDISTQGGATGALAALDTFQQDVDARQGELGAVTNRLEATVSNLLNNRINTEEARSRLQDADIAREVSNRVKGDIQQQAGIALQSQANGNAKNILRLLSN